MTQEMEILHRSVDRLNSRQRLQLQLLRIDYGISINERLLATEELENAESGSGNSKEKALHGQKSIISGSRLFYGAVVLWSRFILFLRE